MSTDFSEEFKKLIAPIREERRSHKRNVNRCPIPIENRMETIKKLGELGCPTERISELTNLSVRTVRNYLAGIPEPRRGTGRPAVDAERCLTPNCKGMTRGGEGGGRGLCRFCHASATNLIKRKKTSWEELESLGLVHPKYGSRFERAFTEAKKKQSEGQ